MPTLVRLFIVLIVLAGLGFAGMLALTIMVDPGEKAVTIKIPARELVPAPESSSIDVNDLPAPANIAPKDVSSSASAPAASASASASTAASEPADLTVDENASESGVKTLTPGGDE